MKMLCCMEAEKCTFESSTLLVCPHAEEGAEVIALHEEGQFQRELHMQSNCSMRRNQAEPTALHVE